MQEKKHVEASRANSNKMRSTDTLPAYVNHPVRLFVILAFVVVVAGFLSASQIPLIASLSQKYVLKEFDPKTVKDLYELWNFWSVVLQGTVGVAAAIAGAFVAILLGSVALRLSQGQHKLELDNLQFETANVINDLEDSAIKPFKAIAGHLEHLYLLAVRIREETDTYLRVMTEMSDIRKILAIHEAHGIGNEWHPSAVADQKDKEDAFAALTALKERTVLILDTNYTELIRVRDRLVSSIESAAANTFFTTWFRSYTKNSELAEIVSSRARKNKARLELVIENLRENTKTVETAVDKVRARDDFRHATRTLQILSDINNPLQIASALRESIDYADADLRVAVVYLWAGSDSAELWVKELQDKDPKRANALRCAGVVSRVVGLGEQVTVAHTLTNRVNGPGTLQEAELVNLRILSMLLGMHFTVQHNGDTLQFPFGDDLLMQILAAVPTEIMLEESLREYFKDVKIVDLDRNMAFRNLVKLDLRNDATKSGLTKLISVYSSSNREIMKNIEQDAPRLPDFENSVLNPASV